MSLETLLEAAEFLEWNKPGVKKSRATRTSKKAENFKPHLPTERKRKASSTRSSQAAKAASPAVSSSSAVSKASDSLDYEDSTPLDSLSASHTVFLSQEEEEVDKLTLKEIRKSFGSRETHNKLEKNRRAHLKECFDQLRKELPFVDERRSSNLSTLKSAIRLIGNLSSQHRDLEGEKKRLQRVKNTKQAQINTLRSELQDRGVEYNIEDWLEGTKSSTNSTNTASECGEGVTDTLAVAAADSGVMNLIEANDHPRNIQPAPVTRSASGEVQLLIKPMPPTKPISSTSSTTLTHSGSLNLQAPLQTVHLVPQTSLNAQTLRVQTTPAPPAHALINTVVLPSLSSEALPITSTVSTQSQQMITATAAQVPQVVTVAKFATAGQNTAIPARILVASKGLPSQTVPTSTTAVTTDSQLDRAYSTAPIATTTPQLCVGPGGQVLLEAPTSSAAPNATNFYIASAASTGQQQIHQYQSAQPQHIAVAADSLASVGSVGGAPLVLNLQSGKIIGQQIPTQSHIIYNKAVPPTAATVGGEQQQANMNIAPKQFVFITPGGNASSAALATASPAAVNKGQQRLAKVQQRPASGVQQTGSTLPTGIALVTANPSQNAVYQQQQQASSHTSGTSSVPNTVLSVAQVPNLQTVPTCTGTVTGGTTATIPAKSVSTPFLTGVLPTTAADGTVTYLPIQFTAAKPATLLPVASRPSVAVTTSAQNSAARPAAQLVAATTTTDSPAPTLAISTLPLSAHTAGGLTFVIPQSATIGSAPGTIQLLAATHTPQRQHQLVTLSPHTAAATVQLAAAPSSTDAATSIA